MPCPAATRDPGGTARQLVRSTSRAGHDRDRRSAGSRRWYTWTVTIARLQDQLREFSAERDWEQFHTPKNLVMALTGEVGELSELFQWLTPSESSQIMSDPVRAVQVRDEIADVLGYLLQLADVLGVDVERALTDKIVKNAAKYPAEVSRSKATKYTELPQG
jgi:NTP pyrophosphatase (non-canonical NTP hydrolase)